MMMMMMGSANYASPCTVDEEDEDAEDEGSANTAKNPVTPAVTAGNKERRKPFFRRVSIVSSHFSVCFSVCLCRSLVAHVVRPILHQNVR